MDLGFETIGNATLICHDGGPVLATDPWIRGAAYFGSWVTSHEIPAEQVESIHACRHLWISHGHPDHLSPESLAELRDKEILLPDHVGGRVRRDLTEQGFRVRVLQDGVWTPLSERMRVLSIADFQQDAILLVDLGGRLIVDSNDASDHGAGAFVRETASRYGDSYLLCLTGYGDADMIHFYDEDGRFIEPPAMRREPFLDGIDALLAAYGIRAYVPFSSQHRYQRTDSAWANAAATPLESYRARLPSDERVLLPPFVRCDFVRDEVSEIDPPPRPEILREPEEFGDDWSEELQPGDGERLERYFRRFEHLPTFLGFLRFVVGGSEHVVRISPDHDRGITFAAPRHSLMQVVEWEVFDDLLIGNYARTTLHGDWGGEQGTKALYPDFNPFVTKYGDNGRAHTAAELSAYFAEYRRRGFFGFADDEDGRKTRRAVERYLS